MADTRRHPVLHYLRQVLGAPAAGGVSDADLLGRFVQARDAAAFELLLWRHAAMVLHVCRQVLRDAAAVEDAFQATFLVLVRKAGSISRRESLGSWLYRVAYRIALKARGQVTKHPTTAAEMDAMEAPADGDDPARRELRRVVCEEVNRLPAKYRAAVVACFFEGKTHEEAAQQLGWPRGTVAGRLARAREMLRRRLVRRGVELTAGALLTALSARTSEAALAELIDNTLEIAKRSVSGESAVSLSPRAADLAEGALQAMAGTRVKSLAVVLLLVGFGGAGATLWATQRKEAEGPADPAPRAGAEAAAPGAGERAEAARPEDPAQLARNMALSRLNLKQLGLAMHNHNDTYGRLAAAITDEKGKPLLSWRVLLLPFIEEQELFGQFKLNEPWDSPHNKKLLSKMPAIYAPPGVKTRQPFSTYYQVFVSAAIPGRPANPVGLPDNGGLRWPGTGGTSPGMGMAGRPMIPGALPGMGMAGGMGPMAPGRGGMRPPAMGPGPRPAAGGAMPGGAPAETHLMAAFLKGQTTTLPADFPDGTSNAILIIEAGNPVPWTKPEDLHYAEDEPLPELGGLFPDVIHALFADGAVHTLTKRYDEKQLRRAITANDGMPLDWVKIQGHARRMAARPGGQKSSLEAWQRKNEELQKEVDQVRERVRQLKEEREVQRELAAEDPWVDQLKQDYARRQAELKKLRAEVEALENELRRMKQPGRTKGP